MLAAWAGLTALGATSVPRGTIREGYLADPTAADALRSISLRSEEVPEAHEPSLQPPVPDPSMKPSGYLCVSTAVHIKTATCNLMCNGRRCPEVCLCMRADVSAISTSLSSAMPSDAFVKLASMLESPDERLAGRQVAFDASAAPKATTTMVRQGVPMAKLPNEMAGYYLKTWNLDSCKKPDSRICQGPDKKNINVAFSGEAILAKALSVTLKQQMKALEQTDGVCSNPDKRFCNQQVHNMMPWEAKTRQLAIEKVIAKGAWTETQCKDCFNDDLNITLPKKDPLPVAKRLHPFSRAAKLHEGLQFLSLGGATGDGSFTVGRLGGFFNGGMEAVKEAGFDGICFDIELTQGGEELVSEFEKVYAACHAEGLLVMITTSHSAPYAASSNHAKQLFVDSWVRSKNIDIFSPQLYTSGYEANADFGQTPCSPQDGIFDSKCSWERLAPMKALWVPSLKDITHYQPTKEYFAKAGIKTHGFVQWADTGGGAAHEQ